MSDNFLKKIAVWILILSVTPLLTHCTKISPPGNIPQGVPPQEAPPSNETDPQIDGPSLGGGSIGGGDTLDSSDWAAWFLGKRKIRYCIEVAPEFPLSLSIVQDQTEKAFEKWRQYIFDNRINQGEGDNANQLATTRQRLESCDGEDIAFRFGMEDKLIESAKRTLNNPIGFAKRTMIDLKNGWAKGFIWIADLTKVKQLGITKHTPDQLLITLIHEIGHVYGNSHIPGTVMTPSAVALLNHLNDFRLKRKLEKGVFFDIDWSDQLVTCVSRAILTGGKDTIGCMKREYTASSPSKEVLEKWLGREMSTEYSLRVTLDLPNAVFTIKDDHGTEEFLVLLDKVPQEGVVTSPLEHCNYGGERIFYRVHKTEEVYTESDIRCSSSVREVGTLYTRLFGKDGTRHNLTLSFDLGNHITIQAVVEGKWETVRFSAPTYSQQICDIRRLSRVLEDDADSLADKTTPERYLGAKPPQQPCDPNSEFKTEEALTPEAVAHILQKPMSAFYYDLLGPRNDAVFSNYSARMLRDRYSEIIPKFEELACQIKRVDHTFDEEAKNLWDATRNSWNAVIDCVTEKPEKAPEFTFPE